jgi:hypothetical protein
MDHDDLVAFLRSEVAQQLSGSRDSSGSRAGAQ